MNVPLRRAEERMRVALETAKRTPAGDVPVGAVVFDADGEVVGRGVNLSLIHI